MNLSLISLNDTLSSLGNAGIDRCKTSAHAYSQECLYQTLCPQFHDYYINIGIGIIISYLLIMWLKWWFFNKGYKLINPVDYPTWSGNLHILENRQYWDYWIERRLSKLCLGFVVVIVYLARWGNYG